jgi:hypothetical protein
MVEVSSINTEITSQNEKLTDNVNETVPTTQTIDSLKSKVIKPVDTNDEKKVI